MSASSLRARAALFALAVVSGAGSVHAQHHTAMDLEVFDPATAISDRRGARIDASLRFVDENGREVALGDYFDGRRPVILNLGYYRCPTVCGPIVQSLVETLGELTLEIGKDYQVVSVSIDPSETADLARGKKDAYLGIFDAPAAETSWHFLTGQKDAIDALCQTVGFGYEWNPFGKVFDHGAGIFVMSPDGVLSQTLYGVTYSDRDLRLALVEASEGKVGSMLDRILLSCYGYNPQTGGYSLMVWTVIRTGGLLTVLAVAAMILFLWRRERRRQHHAGGISAAASTT